MGEKVGTPEGTEGVVTGLDVIRQRVKVLITIDEDNKELHEYDASELKFKLRGGNKPAEKTQPENVEEDKPAREQPKREPKAEEPAQTQDEAEEEKPAKSPRERRHRRPNRRRRGNKKQGEKAAKPNNPAQE